MEGWRGWAVNRVTLTLLAIRTLAPRPGTRPVDQVEGSDHRPSVCAIAVGELQNRGTRS